jgi:hypothetical protein
MTCEVMAANRARERHYRRFLPCLLPTLGAGSIGPLRHPRLAARGDCEHD